jgi:hypothetical protein
MRHGDVHPCEVRDEQRGPGTRCSGQVREPDEVGILPLKRVKEALATADIQTVARGVVEQVVGAV